MKFECVTEKLKEVVGKVEKITQKNSTLPILSCILLVVEKNILTMKATNLDLGVEFSFPVKTHTEGSVAVSASVFSQFLSGIVGEKSVLIYLDENILHLETDKSKTDIKTFPIEDFPIIPRVEEGKEFDYQVVVYNNEDYRVPASVLNNIQTILKAKPTLKTVKVIKQGQGFNTNYTVVPLD